MSDSKWREEAVTQFLSNWGFRHNDGGRKDLEAILLRVEAETIERCAKAVKGMKKECTCACVDIGVGNLHEPTCGLPNLNEVSSMLLAMKGKKGIV